MVIIFLLISVFCLYLRALAESLISVISIIRLKDEATEGKYSEFINLLMFAYTEFGYFIIFFKPFFDLLMDTNELDRLPEDRLSKQSDYLLSVLQVKSHSVDQEASLMSVSNLNINIVKEMIGQVSFIVQNLQQIFQQIKLPQMYSIICKIHQTSAKMNLYLIEKLEKLKEKSKQRVSIIMPSIHSERLKQAEPIQRLSQAQAHKQSKKKMYQMGGVCLCEETYRRKLDKEVIRSDQKKDECQKKSITKMEESSSPTNYYVLKKNIFDKINRELGAAQQIIYEPMADEISSFVVFEKKFLETFNHYSREEDLKNISELFYNSQIEAAEFLKKSGMTEEVSKFNFSLNALLEELKDEKSIRDGKIENKFSKILSNFMMKKAEANKKISEKIREQEELIEKKKCSKAQIGVQTVIKEFATIKNLERELEYQQNKFAMIQSSKESNYKELAAKNERKISNLEKKNIELQNADRNLKEEMNILKAENKKLRQILQKDKIPLINLKGHIKNEVNQEKQENVKAQVDQLTLQKTISIENKKKHRISVGKYKEPAQQEDEKLILAEQRESRKFEDRVEKNPKILRESQVSHTASAVSGQNSRIFGEVSRKIIILSQASKHSSTTSKKNITNNQQSSILAVSNRAPDSIYQKNALFNEIKDESLSSAYEFKIMSPTSQRQAQRMPIAQNLRELSDGNVSQSACNNQKTVLKQLRQLKQLKQSKQSKQSKQLKQNNPKLIKLHFNSMGESENECQKHEQAIELSGKKSPMYQKTKSSKSMKSKEYLTNRTNRHVQSIPSERERGDGKKGGTKSNSKMSFHRLYEISMGSQTREQRIQSIEEYSYLSRANVNKSHSNSDCSLRDYKVLKKAMFSAKKIEAMRLQKLIQKEQRPDSHSLHVGQSKNSMEVNKIDRSYSSGDQNHELFQIPCRYRSLSKEKDRYQMRRQTQSKYNNFESKKQSQPNSNACKIRESLYLKVKKIVNYQSSNEDHLREENTRLLKKKSEKKKFERHNYYNANKDSIVHLPKLECKTVFPAK